jgi:nitroreductase
MATSLHSETLDTDHRSTERPSLRLALSRRYAEAAPADPDLQGRPDALNVVTSLLVHRSVRRFTSQPLPEGSVELLVASAQSASSSSNLQLWSVIDVRDPARRAALYEVAGRQAHILECPSLLVWVADLNRPTALAEQQGIGHAGLDYLEMFLMASIDTALAAQNAVVAAEALGFGVVYIGALRNDPERVAEVLGLPPRAYAVFGLCVGWPHAEAEGAVKPRLPRSIVLHRDEYQSVAAQRAVLQDYDERMSAFYTEQRMPVPAGGWSRHSSERIATVAALRGRDRLRTALNALGFALR